MDEIVKERVIFFGSGDFPRKTFIKMCTDNPSIKIVGLVTSYDKCEDKRKTLKECAEEYNIPYITVKDCESDELLEWCKDLNPTMYVVISFKKIPERLLKVVDNVAFNIHASMLPLLRGSNPIRWAIRYKMKNTGLTAIMLSDKIDNGFILDNISVDIHDDDTYGTLKDRLADICQYFTLTVAMRYHDIKPVYNSTCGLNLPIFKAPKLNKEYFNSIEYHDDLEVVLRSLLPYDGIKCKLLVWEKYTTYEYGCKAEEEHIVDSFDCTIWNLHKHNIMQNTDENRRVLNDIWYDIDEVQIEGKKRMPIDEFLRGFKYSKDKTGVYKVRFKLF